MQTGPNKLHFLLHTATLVEEKLREQLAQSGVSPRQARVLDALAHLETASQAQLARLSSLTAASMSTMTARLLNAGYISRIPHPHEARSNVLSLTPEGRSKLEEIQAAWNDTDQMIVDLLGEAQAAQLFTSLHALRDALGGKTPEHHLPQPD